jgi:hypothetical protein
MLKSLLTTVCAMGVETTVVGVVTIDMIVVGVVTVAVT